MLDAADRSSRLHEQLAAAALRVLRDAGAAARGEARADARAELDALRALLRPTMQPPSVVAQLGRLAAALGRADEEAAREAPSSRSAARRAGPCPAAPAAGDRACLLSRALSSADACATSRRPRRLKLSAFSRGRTEGRCSD